MNSFGLQVDVEETPIRICKRLFWRFPFTTDPMAPSPTQGNTATSYLAVQANIASQVNPTLPVLKRIGLN
jgi:hypothetical protein